VLRREIVATGAVNHLINRAGITFLSRLTAGGAGLGDVITAWVDVDRETKAEDLRRQLLDTGLGATAEQEALLEIEAVLEELAKGVLAGNKPKLAGALDPIRKKLKL